MAKAIDWMENEKKMITQISVLTRGVEIVTFSTFPGTSKWPQCTCP